MQYLKAEPVYHTFLLSDLECYGFEHEFQQVYMQEKEGICEGVVLRYYNNLILSEFIEKPECKKIAELVTSEPEALAEDMMALKDICCLKIFGGCCGTDGRHMREIARRLD